MCNQCPTVGEFLCSILRGGCCNNTCEKRPVRKCENKCEHKCERDEKRYECFCREKQEHAPCEKCNHVEKEHDKTDCCCKFF